MNAVAAIVSALLAMIVAAGSATAAVQSGRVAGSVVDSTAAALSGAVVTYSGTATGEVTSDDAGEFAVLLPAGEYRFTVVLDGFAASERVVTVAAGESVRLRFELTLAASERTTVTATRLGAEDAINTSQAVTTLSGADLNRLKARNVEEIAGTAPGLTFSQNTGFSQITIRGIGSTAVFAGTDPSSAFYIDGVYIARPVAILTEFADLERVEVLRGSQSILFGRNTIGGAVNLITRAPTVDPQLSMAVQVSNFHGYRVRGRISGPLLANRAIGSIAAVHARQRGTVHDEGFPTRPVGSENTTAVRGKVQIFAAGRADLTATIETNHQDPIPLGYFKVLAAKPGFTFDNPGGPRDVKTSVAGMTSTVQYAGSLRADVRLPHGLNLSSHLAYRTLDHMLDVDGDITELNLSETHLREQQHQLSEEITLSQRHARIGWIAGAFLFSEHDHQPTRVTLPTAARELLLDPHADMFSRAMFGQASVVLTQIISATAGLRYTNDRKDWQNAGDVRALPGAFVILPGTAYRYEETMSNAAWTPRVVIEARLPQGPLAFISATRGFKSGGYNLSSMVMGRGFAPEQAWTYESGIKAPVGRSRASLSLFHTDHRDLQVQTAILPGIIDISNAAEATIRGVELEWHSGLGGNVATGGHAAFLDATYDRYLAVGVGAVTGDVAGNRLNNAPQWSGRWFVEWRPRTRLAVRSLRAETTGQSTVYFSPFNDNIQRQRPYGLLHLAAELGPASRQWRVLIFARNVTETNYITGSFSSPPPAIGGRPGEARRFGVEFSLGQ